MAAKARNKFIHGPGGAACSCCRVGSKSSAKRGASRHVRRAAKLELKSNA